MQNYDIRNIHVHYKTLAAYEHDRDTAGKLDPNAVVFVKETGKIYTHGKEYGGDSINITEINNRFETLEAAVNRLSSNAQSNTTIEVTDPQTGQILIYDKNEGKWQNKYPNRFVTIDTKQTITGEKTFVSDVTVEGKVKFPVYSYNE